MIKSNTSIHSQVLNTLSLSFPIIIGQIGSVLMGITDTIMLGQVGKEEVGSIASVVSQFPRVRSALLQSQRDCATIEPGLVAEGRDCGTVVFPKAHLKIYLTASSEDRAQRRAQEQGHALEHTMALQIERDSRDSERKAAPLQIPDDAKVLDTTLLSLNEVVDEVVKILEFGESKSLPR